MIMQPFFSIVTVSYNSAKTIEKTIQSVLAQSFTDYEYWLIDGQSRDNTIEIAKQYEEQFEGKMHIISEPDGGIYDAMNKGIKYSKGKLICLLNSDDWFEKDALKIVKEHHCGKKYEVDYGMARIMHGDKEAYSAIYSHEFLSEHALLHQACFVTRSCYEKYGLFSKDFDLVSDYEFFLRLRKHRDVLFVPIHHIIACERTGGLSHTGKAMREAAKLRYKYRIIGKPQVLIGYMKGMLADLKLLK